MSNIPDTIIIDIDGVIFEQNGNMYDQIKNPPRLLPGVLEKFIEWEQSGCHIILLTARKEGCRYITQKQLALFGIVYDQLIMGITSGKRILINDYKINSTQPTAIAICIDRNTKMKDL